MYHPDFSLTPVAGTAFFSGKGPEKYPFLPKAAPQSEEAVKNFHKCKLNASQRDFFETLAIMLQEMAGHRDVMKLWSRVDSHFVFEGHLPSTVSLTYVDEVIMPQDLYDALKPESKQILAGLLPQDRIILTSPFGNPPAPDKKKECMDKVLERGLADVHTQHIPGYALACKKGQHVAELPICIPDSWDEAHVYFRARALHFQLVLVAREPARSVLVSVQQASQMHAGLAYIAAGANAESHEGVLARLRLPGNTDIVSSDKFGWPGADRIFVDYHVSCVKGEVVLEYYGPSRCLSRTQLRLPRCRNSPERLRSLALFGLGSVATFENVRVFRDVQPKLSPTVDAPTIDALPTAVAKHTAGKSPKTSTPTAAAASKPKRIKWQWDQKGSRSDPEFVDYPPAVAETLETGFAVCTDLIAWYCCLIHNAGQQAGAGLWL